MTQLTDKQHKIRQKLGIRKTIKLVRYTTNHRNGLCDGCRIEFDKAQGMLDDPEDYCKDCKEKAEVYLKKVGDLCK